MAVNLNPPKSNHHVPYFHLRQIMIPSPYYHDQFTTLELRLGG